MEQLQSELGNRGLTVSKLPEKGRCLLTTKEFYPGEVIISQEPYVFVPNNSAHSSKCDGCFESSHLKKCSRCQVIYYCSATCQKSEWKLHRLECEALSKLPKEKRKAVTPSLRLMIRLYSRAKLQSQKTIGVSAMDNYSLVEALVAHMSEVDEKQMVLYAQMANLVSLILQWPDINIKEIAENFSKFACNAHTICDSELKPLGTGLYPVISIINHSCLPNSVLLFEGRTAVVRAVQHIPRGTEVLISYIDTAGSTVTRQKALKEQYLFTCACPRCIKAGQFEDIQESILEGHRCKDNTCDGFLLRDPDDKGFICQRCGLLKSKEEIIEMETEMRSLQEKGYYGCRICSLYQLAYHNVIAILKEMETVQRYLCHDFCIYLIPTWEKLIEYLMKVEDWSEALAYCRLTIPVYQRVYPGFHPSLGLQYYTCGKLEWLLGETDDAVKSLTKAVDILRITHGTSTPFMKDLFRRLEEARAEALHWLICHKSDVKIKRVVSLDLATEKYAEFPIPPIDLKFSTKVTLEVLGGYLCVCGIADPGRDARTLKFRDEVWNLWIMKEYGVAASWTRLYTIENVRSSRMRNRYCKPLLFSETGEKVLLQIGNEVLGWYDFEKKKIEYVDIPDTTSQFSTAICVGNLCLLDGDSCTLNFVPVIDEGE